MSPSSIHWGNTMSAIESIEVLRTVLRRLKSRLMNLRTAKEAEGNEKGVNQLGDELSILGLVEAALAFTPFAAALRSENVTRCKSCNAEMTWIQMKSGRKNPVNADETAAIVTQSGEVKKGTVLGILVMTDEGYAFGRTSHFATCPDAKQHRRKHGEKKEKGNG